MKFHLKTSGTFYRDEEQRNRLSSLGFKFDMENSHAPMLMDKEVIIDINSLEELIEFTEKHGAVIISEGEIEIYDDWRE